MKKSLIAASGAILAAATLAACDSYPAPAKINNACSKDGGAAFIQQHNPPGDEGDVNFIERCKDNRIIVVKP